MAASKGDGEVPIVPPTRAEVDALRATLADDAGAFEAITTNAHNHALIHNSRQLAIADDRAALLASQGKAGGRGSIAGIEKAAERLAQRVEERMIARDRTLAALDEHPDYSDVGRAARKAEVREQFAKDIEPLVESEFAHATSLASGYRATLESELRAALGEATSMTPAEKREHARDFAYATLGLSGKQLAAAYKEFGSTTPWASEALDVVAVRLIDDAETWSQLRVEMTHAKARRVEALLNGPDATSKRLRDVAARLSLLTQAEQRFASVRTILAGNPSAADIARAQAAKWSE